MINLDSFIYKSFLVNPSGEVNIEHLDRNIEQNDKLAIFSRQEIESLDIDSDFFLQEAINRALSISELDNRLFQKYIAQSTQNTLIPETEHFAIILIRDEKVLEIIASPQVENGRFSSELTLSQTDLHKELETDFCDTEEHILIKDIFSDDTLVEFYCNININILNQIST